MPFCRRIQVATSILAALATLVLGLVALAASLTFAGGSLGASKISTPRCTATGLSVLQNLSSGTVVSVTVSNLPSACGGATLQVTLNNGTANASGSATVPSGGGSVTVTLASAPAVAAAESTDLVILGP